MEIFREFTFEAAHRLIHVPDGHKCARLHGHSYRVEIRVAGPVGEQTGWVMDFADLNEAFRPFYVRTLLGAAGMKAHKRFTLEILED